MDCLVLLSHEHDRLEELFSRFEHGDESIVAELCQSLDEHLVHEADVLYPAVLTEIDGALPVLAACKREQDELRRLLRDLAADTSADPTDRTRARDLVAVAREFVIDEESELFPLVSSSLTVARREQLGEAIEALRRARPGGDQGASSDGDGSWTKDPYLSQVVDPDVDRSVESAMRRSQELHPPDV